jgi:hypothetical protein
MHTRPATHSAPQQEHLQEMRKPRQIGGEPAFGRLSEQKKERKTQWSTQVRKAAVPRRRHDAKIVDDSSHAEKQPNPNRDTHAFTSLQQIEKTHVCMSYPIP